MTLSVALLVAVGVFTEAQPLAFEVASVKPHESQDVGFTYESDTRVQYRRVALFTLILKAYGVEFNQVIVPDWIRTRRYDIEANLPAGAARADIPVMLQELFKEYFDLEVHEEIKDSPVYAIVIGRGGHKMRSCTECPPGKSISKSDISITVQATSVADLAHRLLDGSDRPIVDRTNLSGNFEIRVDGAQLGADSSKTVGVPSMSSELEKLGLRLESTRAPIKFIVVDSGNPTPKQN